VKNRPSKSRFFLFLLLIFALPAHSFGAPLDTLVDPAHAAALRRGERVSQIQQKNPAAVLIPRNNSIKTLTDRLIRDLDPNFFIETLALYRKPAGAASVWTSAERNGLYNQALALSSLAGLQYYSASRKTMRTFYETSTVVSGPDGKTPRPDPGYASPPTELTIYARQKDLSFGENVYRYDYYAQPDSLIFVQENLTAMNYGIIPAVGKNKLRSIVAVFDAGDSLLIYVASMARAASVPGLNEKVSNSFTNRAEAVLNWFSGQADKVFKKNP
jgi:hypothetical protein